MASLRLQARWRLRHPAALATGMFRCLSATLGVMNSCIGAGELDISLQVQSSRGAVPQSSAWPYEASTPALTGTHMNESHLKAHANRRIRSQSAMAASIVTLCCASVHAQTTSPCNSKSLEKCDQSLTAKATAEWCKAYDEAAFGSDPWFSAAAGCGIRSALNSGVDLISSKAKDYFKSSLKLLGSTALSNLGPLGADIAGLLFGTGSGAAENTERILNAIEASTQQTLRALTCAKYDEQTLVQWPLLQYDFERTCTYADVDARWVVSDNLWSLDSRMQALAQSIMALPATYGIDGNHTLAHLTRLHLLLIEQECETFGLDVAATKSGTTVMDEWSEDIQAAADDQRRICRNKQLSLVLRQGGVLDFFEQSGTAVAPRTSNVWRHYADASISGPDWGDVISTVTPRCSDGRCTSTFFSGSPASYTHTVNTNGCNLPQGDAAAGTVINEPTKTVFTIQSSSLPPAGAEVVDVPSTCNPAPTGAAPAFSVTMPDGRVFTELVRGIAFANSCSMLEGGRAAVRRLVQRHKDWAYTESLVRNYGTIRNEIDLFYAWNSEPRPGSYSSADLDLDSEIVDKTPVNSMAVDAMVNATRDKRSLSRVERRAVANYLLMNKAPALDGMVQYQMGIDPFVAAQGGPLLSDFMELVYASETDYAPLLQSRFVAKLMAAIGT
jgi:hypothetical protein